ncbi:hypothetical protein GGR57DRAFT_406229 [Xylariaceae sp. FL1272]|nr:hypothetical protein GGR57DRAFT_406229 [Xylariaceae sp. FL1272]
MTADDQSDLMSMFDSGMFDGMPMTFNSFGDFTIPQQQFQPVESNEASPQPFAQADSASTIAPNPEDSPMGPPAPQNNGNAGTPTRQAAQTGGILSEFTKRRDWPAKVVEELKDLLHILDAHGRVKYVSPGASALIGFEPDEICDTFLKELIHPDDVGTFTSEMNESIATGNPFRMFYRMRKKDHQYGIFESVGHAHIAASKFAPNPENQSPFCQAVFVMSRPYPTRNAYLLDTFLEHKIENERLRRRIAELRREEEEEEEASQLSYLLESRSDAAQSEDTMMSNSQGHPVLSHSNSLSDAQAMPPPERPLNIALTRENLEGVVGNRPDSIREKMARYEGSHTDTIEMLTGLRYLEGERSRGITTGGSSPTLIKGDAGIAIPVERDPKTGEKKKKLKIAEEYVCTDCGTLDSPEWRKGPSGPKTLCNACGLRWAKKEKKRNASGSGAGHQPPSLPAGESA